ncbi:hypothetical protein VKS41_003700 [Umbelopsis sp. WA50703]
MQQAMPAQKKVQFSQAIEFIDTFGDDEYDRTCLETTPCTYKDMFELYQLRLELRKETERMLSERDAQDAMNEADYASSTSSPATSTSSSYEVFI